MQKTHRHLFQNMTASTEVVPDALRPTCIVCKELAFNAMVSGACGHTVCELCLMKLKGPITLIATCPECRQATANWIPNFAVRRMLECPHFASELKERWDETDEGKINEIVVRRGLHVARNDFKPAKALQCLQMIDMYLEEADDASHARWAEMGRQNHGFANKCLMLVGEHMACSYKVDRAGMMNVVFAGPDCSKQQFLFVEIM